MAENNNSNINITPEMISNLANMLNNANINSTKTNQDGQTSTTQSNSFDSSMNFSNIFGGSDSSNNIDFDTFLKMKNIIEKLNSNDNPRQNLLHSLKPYLRESKQKKLDQYANLLKFTEITELFKGNKGVES